MASNNPFDTSIFNEVRPTYIGPPVEELGQAKEYLTNTIKENRMAANLLDEGFANSIANMQGDDEGVAMILEHKNRFAKSLEEVTNERNLAYAGNVIQKNVNSFVGDYRIKGRQKLVDEYKGQVDAVLKNDKIPVRTRQAMAENYKMDKYATRDDKFGIYELKELPLPFERIDINDELLKIAKAQLPYPDGVGTAYAQFIDVNGNYSSSYDPNGSFVMMANGKEVSERKDASKLQGAFEAAIKNNDAMLGYLIQESVVGDYYNDKSKNPVDRMQELYTNPELRDKVALEASSKLAENLAYNRSIKDADITSLSLYDRSTKTGNTPDAVGTQYSAAGNSYARNSTRDEVDNTISTSGTALSGVLGVPNATAEENTVFNQAVANNDYQAAMKIGAKYMTPEDVESTISLSKELQLQQDIATQKLNNAQSIAAERTGINEIINNPLFNELSKDGYDYTAAPGNTEFDKKVNTLSEINDRYNYLLNTKGGTDIGDNPWVYDYNKTLAEKVKLDKYVPLFDNFNRKYKNYNRETNKIIEQKADVIDEISHTIPQESKLFALLEENFNLPALMDMPVYDAKDANKEIDLSNYGEIKINSVNLSPIKAGGTGSASWLIRATGTTKEKDSKKETHPINIRVAVESGEGGLQPEMYNEIISDPTYQASKMLTEITTSNIPGEVDVPGHKGFKVANGKDFYLPNGKRANSSTQFIDALGRDIVTKRIEALSYDNSGNSKADDLYQAVSQINSNTNPKDIPDIISKAIFGSEYRSVGDIEKQRINRIINLLQNGK